MTTYWAEHAWLPTGLASEVRFEVDRGRHLHRRAREVAAARR